MNVHELAGAVKAMRDYQKEYFKVSSKCAKSGFHPDLVKEKRKLLDLSKGAERFVDQKVNEILEADQSNQETLFS